MSSTLVFVYGTLKRGLSNHGWLRGQTFEGEARTVPRYRMFDLGGYPGMVLADEGEGGAIEGEVWAVDEEGLRGRCVSRRASNSEICNLSLSFSVQKSSC